MPSLRGGDGPVVCPRAGLGDLGTQQAGSRSLCCLETEINCEVRDCSPESELQRG